MALLAPVTPEEQTLANLFTELTVIADRYHDDTVMVGAVEQLGSAIITLTNGEVGRIDPSYLNKQVHDTIMRAGGDPNGL